MCILCAPVFCRGIFTAKRIRARGWDTQDISEELPLYVKERIAVEAKKVMFSTRTLVTVGLLSALAYVLMLLESPAYIGFLRIEFSDVPAVVGGLSFGPAAGVFIELVKNLLKVISNTKTIGAGELANLIVGCAYVVPLCVIYRRYRSKYNLLAGFAVGTVVMCLAGIVANYFITLPFYSQMFGGMSNLIDMVGSLTPGFLPKIDSLWGIVIIGITPFNVVKGIMISVVSYYVYKIVRKPLQA